MKKICVLVWGGRRVPLCQNGLIVYSENEVKLCLSSGSIRSQSPDDDRRNENVARRAIAKHRYDGTFVPFFRWLDWSRTSVIESYLKPPHDYIPRTGISGQSVPNQPNVSDLTKRTLDEFPSQRLGRSSRTRFEVTYGPRGRQSDTLSGYFLTRTTFFDIVTRNTPALRRYPDDDPSAESRRTHANLRYRICQHSENPFRPSVGRGPVSQ